MYITSNYAELLLVWILEVDNTNWVNVSELNRGKYEEQSLPEFLFLRWKEGLMRSEYCAFQLEVYTALNNWQKSHCQKFHSSVLCLEGKDWRCLCMQWKTLIAVFKTATAGVSRHQALVWQSFAMEMTNLVWHFATAIVAELSWLTKTQPNMVCMKKQFDYDELCPRDFSQSL